MFKQPAHSDGLGHRVADQANRSAFKQQRSLKTGDNGKQINNQ